MRIIFLSFFSWYNRGFTLAIEGVVHDALN